MSQYVIVKEVRVNGTEFRVTLTDQTIRQVNSLKSLYDAAYEDPESFDQISYQISSTINEIASAAEPRASDGDLNGLIQEIIRMAENKEAAVQQMMTSTKKKKSRSRRATAAKNP